MPKRIYEIDSVKIKDLSDRGKKIYGFLNNHFGKIFTYHLEIQKSDLADMLDKFLINNCDKSLALSLGRKEKEVIIK